MCICACVFGQWEWVGKSLHWVHYPLFILLRLVQTLLWLQAASHTGPSRWFPWGSPAASVIWRLYKWLVYITGSVYYRLIFLPLHCWQNNCFGETAEAPGGLALLDSPDQPDFDSSRTVVSSVGLAAVSLAETAERWQVQTAQKCIC